LTQYLFPVGFGPSGNMWPRWEEQILQSISVLIMPRVVSSLVSIFSATASKKLGHPEPDSYFVEESNNISLQTAHT